MADLAAKLAEEVTCSICHEYYRTPKVLGCMHRFCKDCLHSYVVKQARENGVSCPECRQVTRAPQHRSKKILLPREWAEKFPTDFLVQTMVESLRKQKTTDECLIHAGNPVVLFCQDCKALICHVCAGVDHRKCDGVVSLRSQADKERERLKNQLETLEARKKISVENEEEMTDVMDELNTNYDKASQKIKRAYSDIRKKLVTRESLALVYLRSQMFTDTAEFTRVSLQEKCNQVSIMDSQRKISRFMKTRSDAQLVREKLQLNIPEVEKREKRKIPSDDEMYNTVAKSFKIEESKKHFDID